MINYKITLWKLNSKGKEQIIECKIFNERYKAIEFLESYNAEPKPYKMQKDVINYVMSV